MNTKIWMEKLEGRDQLGKQAVNRSH